MAFKHTVSVCIFVICVGTGPRSYSAETSAGKTRAMFAIFAEEHIAESVLTITARAALMPAEERYSFLASWVLPNERHESLRLQIDFTPTQPAPPVDREAPRDGRRISSGGRMISPALDLVDTAAEIGKLDEILKKLERFKATKLLDQKNRLAMLSMILLKQKKLEEALTQIDAFCQLSAQEKPDDQVNRAAEALLFVSSLPFADASEVVGPTIDRVLNRHRAKFTRSAWSRQFRSLQSLRVKNLSDAAPAASSSQWGTFSTISAETRGVGIPASQWHLKKGQADNITSHGDDYLFFAIPMRGNYQIECDVTAFNWSETRLLVGGKWVSPHYDYINYTLGDMRNQQEDRPIEPRLTKGDEKLHYRTEVRDAKATTFVEGRTVHTEDLSEHYDPWVALRNGDAQEGSAFNVRVTGTPEIPQTISMTPTSNLASWLPYYGDTLAQWQGVPSGGIHGLPDGGEWESEPAATAVPLPNAVPLTIAFPLTGETHHEQAMFYQRPMLEDGTIEYEFFYSEGKQNAHPMLDRLCFLMDPKGIKVHWLTDGIFDCTELSPDNETVEVAKRRGPKSLPLIANAWNRASVTLNGDVINIVLNDQLVYQRTLESTNQRHFGFFYFSDQSELLVRNVQWTGKWPRELMPVQDQELSVDVAEFLDQKSEHLTAVFEHDFVKDGMNEDRMTTVEGSAQDNLQIIPEGVLALRPGMDGYRNITIAPNLQVQGDFDITAAYADFQSSPTAGGSSSLRLSAHLDNAASDEFFVTRRHMIDDRGNEQQLVQCVTVTKPPEGEKHDYFLTRVMEERSGRLRIARRGKTVYYLSAEGDSPNFRLWASRDFSSDPIAMHGIRLVNQMHQIGSSSVIWKSIIVRAEKFSGAAKVEVDARLVALNEQREMLPVKVVYDFTKAPPDPRALYRWVDLRDWNPTHKGLRMLAEGFDSWESAGICTLNPISGDFDVSAEFEVVSMDNPRADDQTAVFLQLDSTDNQQTQFNSIFNLAKSGFKEAVCQLRLTSVEAKQDYRDVGKFSMKSVSALRMTRRGNQWTTIARNADSGAERIIAQAELSDLPISRARLLLHTGGANRQSEILLKKLKIHAAEYSPDTQVPVVPKRGKTAVESFFDLFK